MAFSKEQLIQIINDRERVLFADEIQESFLSDKLGRLKGKADALVFVKSHYSGFVLIILYLIFCWYQMIF